MVNSFLKSDEISRILRDFYSRPYARGDEHDEPFYLSIGIFLLPPLREGRHFPGQEWGFRPIISTHAPTRGATRGCATPGCTNFLFLLTPLREGRHAALMRRYRPAPHFYSRPYARGDEARRAGRAATRSHFYSRPYARGDSNFSQNHKLIYMINC